MLEKTSVQLIGIQLFGVILNQYLIRLNLKSNFTKTLNFENLLIFLFIFFLIITNNYFGEFNINSSATSSHYYLQIANSFPDVVEFNDNSQTYIHAERFLISYLIGFFSNLLNIKVFYIFCLFSYSLIA